MMKIQNLLKRKQSEDGSLTSFYKRVIAYSIDNAIVIFLRYVFALILFYSWFGKSLEIFFRKYSIIMQEKGEKFFSNQDFIISFLRDSIFSEFLFFVFLIFIIGTFYWVITPLLNGGATIGKRVMNLKVVQGNGDKLGLSAILFRYCVSLIPWFFNVAALLLLIKQNLILFLLPLFFVTIWYEPRLRPMRVRHKTLHDIICDTVVVKNGD